MSVRFNGASTMKIDASSRFIRLTPRSADAPKQSDTPALLTRSREEDSPARRLADMQNAIGKMPSPKQLQNQARAAKISFLKQRLEAMKKFLMFATPAQAKNIARELKNIASELAAAAHELSSSGNASASGPKPALIIASAEEAGTAEYPAAEQDAARSAEAAADDAEAIRQQGMSDTKDAVRRSEENGDATGEAEQKTDAPDKTGEADAALRAMLKDAVKLFKSVLAQLKARLDPADKGSRDTLKTIDSALEKIDEALGTSFALPDSYAHLSHGVEMADVTAIAPAGSGASIDVCA